MFICRCNYEYLLTYTSPPFSTLELLIRVLSTLRKAHSKTGLQVVKRAEDVPRAVFTHGPQGPGPRAANFQGRHIKKIDIEVWCAEKKAVHEREIYGRSKLKTL
jgi:hypothetical protein